MGTSCYSVSGNPAKILSPAVAPIESLKAHFLPIWGGSGTPSPTNVRPISGRTGLTVYKSGGNVLPFESVLTEGYTNTVDGVTATYSKGIVTLSGTHSVSGWSTLFAFNTVWASDPIVLPAGTYNFARGSDNGTYSDFCVCCQIDGGSTENKSTVITATQSVTVFGFYVAVHGEVEVNSTTALVMAPGESRPTKYEPYMPIETIYADWTSAGTVYGGYYDIATGDLKSDYRMWTRNSSEMNRESDAYPGWNQCGIKNVVGETDGSYYPSGGAGSYMNCGGRISITTTGVADNAYLPRQTYGLTEAEWKALAIDVQFCFHLSTPDDVATLTPLPLTTWCGVTYIWSNLGDIDVEYKVADSIEMVKAKKRAIAAAPHLMYDTSATAVKKFSTDMKSPLKTCAVAVGPTQEGTGTPALDNRRNIVGYDKLGVRHTGKNLYQVIGFACQADIAEENISIFSASASNRGTTLSTCMGNSVTVTQSLYNPDEPKDSYKNGYFCIAFHKMPYNKTYNISFDVVDISSNPLNASLSDIRLCNPFGSKNGNVTVDGNRVIVSRYYHRKYANDDRYMVQVYNCGMSFTLTNIMVTDQNETDQTFEPFVPVLGKNIGIIAGYSANQRGARVLTNSYGTTVNRRDFVLPDTPLVITQSTSSSSYDKYSYRNGYFGVDLIGLEFGKQYKASFKVTNIVSNPLNATLSDLRISSPGGNHNTVERVDGDRVFFNLDYRMSESYPQTTGLDIRNCGMSFTMSELMITEYDEPDQTYVPCLDNEYLVECPETLCVGKNLYPFAVETYTPLANVNGYFFFGGSWKVPDRSKTYTYSAYIDNTNGETPSHATIWMRNSDDSGWADSTARVGNDIAVGSVGYSTVSINFASGSYPNTYYLCFGGGIAANATITRPMVEQATSRTDYEPYDKRVYGAVMEMKEGAMFITHRCIEIPFEKDWSEQDIYFAKYQTYTGTPKFRSEIKDFFVSHHKNSTGIAGSVYINSSGHVFFGKTFASDLGISTSAELNSWLKSQHDNGTPLQVCGELLEPIYIPIDPQQIKTLRGNNVFSIEGNSAMVLRYWTH